MSGRGKSRGRGSAGGGRGGRGRGGRGGRGGRAGAGAEAPAPVPNTKIISPFETIAHRAKHPVINKRVMPQPSNPFLPPNIPPLTRASRRSGEG
jgi:hypothetical protein